MPRISFESISWKFPRDSKVALLVISFVAVGVAVT